MKTREILKNSIKNYSTFNIFFSLIEILLFGEIYAEKKSFVFVQPNIRYKKKGSGSDKLTKLVLTRVNIH